MATPIQALQNNQQGPSPATQDQKKVTFQQPPPSQMKNGPHRIPKQETELPHPDIGNKFIPPQNKSSMKQPVQQQNELLQKGLKIPDSINSENGNIQEQLKEVFLIILLSNILFSEPVQDCFNNIIPGNMEKKQSMISVILASSILGGAFFLSKKFLL